MQPEAEDNERQAIPPTCPGWCVGHDTDVPDGTDDHVHEATPVLVPRTALERTADEAGQLWIGSDTCCLLMP